MESLGNPGMLAEVAQFYTLITHVLVYAKLTQSIQKLSESMHKISNGIQ
jgi:hypothetical protein